VPTVRISANIIHWPNTCPCCCAPADDTTEVASTRYTGKRVVRSQTKVWRVPYCRACLRHVDAAPRINDLEQQIDRSRPPGNYYPLTVLSSVLGGLLGLLLLCCGGLSIDQPAVTVVFVLLALLLAGGAVALGLLVLVKQDRTNHRQAVRRYEERLADMKHELRERKQRAPLFGSCSTAGNLAVSYEGWYGTIHTFEFDSPQYADQFRQSNRGKIVG
jgi:hypothetical protein